LLCTLALRRPTVQVGFFGPLVDRMVVSRPVLAPLVRMTAMNAFRRVRALEAESASNSAPYANRLKLIQELTAKCKLADLTYDGFLRTVFAGRRDLAAQAM